jgi:hypothetical protein
MERKAKAGQYKIADSEIYRACNTSGVLGKCVHIFDWKIYREGIA